ncbi:hypothetical protein AAGG91_002767 [Salmonella enterica]|nr:DNA condensation protein [Salmonella phage Munch]EHX8550752.1 hypothetical protein [Salmonella enterica]ELL7856385.1 hypothetical protein [Salmonella enterica]MCP0435463.1 hypothetical protein [Salmonella enterica subsp. enterica serovar Mbandaka]
MIPFTRILSYGNEVKAPTILGERVQVNYSAAWYLHRNGDLYAIGQNNLGQLGTGDTTNLSSWTKVLTRVKRYFGGVHGTLAIDEDNIMWYTGSTYGMPIAQNTRSFVNVTKYFSDFGVSPDDIKSVYIAEGIRVLLNNGKWFFYGSNSAGCFGTGSSASVTKFTYSSIENVQYMSCGFNTTCLILSDGSCYYAGTMMLSGTTPTSVPTFTKTLDDVLYTANTFYTTYYFMKDGSIRTASINTQGQGSVGNTNPVLNSVQIRTQFDPSVPLRVIGSLSNSAGMSPMIWINNQIWRCGFNIYGQCGNGAASSAQATLTPMIFGTVSNIVSFGGDNLFSMVIDNNDDMFVCGNTPINGISFYNRLTRLADEKMPWK